MPKLPTENVDALPTLDPASAKKVIAAATAGLGVGGPAPPVVAIHPGVERWPVKTGTDKDVAKVGSNKIGGVDLGKGVVDTTIEAMLKFKRPPNMPPVTSSFPANSFYQDQRGAPTETTIWRITATVTEAKLEADGDYHLVLKGTSGRTMIAEIPDPDPAFVKNPAWLAQIKKARVAMDQKLGGPLEAVDFNPAAMAPPTTERFSAGPAPESFASMTPVNAKAVIIGVGFFDSSHGQTGVAPTAIEIHPVFSLKFV